MRLHAYPHTHMRVTYVALVHLYCYPWPEPCVPVIPAVTRPSDSKAFGAGQSLLDTVWTRPYAGGRVFSGRGGPWGEPGAAVHA
jgi:hypothetical protein